MSIFTQNGKLQLRRDSSSVWTSKNPILLSGEIGIEIDTGKIKIGDGFTVWNSLIYVIGTRVPENANFNTGTYDVATTTTAGLIKSGTDITVDSSGNVSVNDNSHNHVIGNIEGLQTSLDSKLSTTGNAVSATRLETARLINGVSFDGTQNIIIDSDGGTY